MKITHYLYFSLFIILHSHSAAASDASNTAPLEFSMTAEHQDSQFKFNTINYKTRLDTLGVNWYEIFTPYFHAGLEAGYIEMSQLDNPVAAARYTSGQYAGFLLRILPVTLTHFQLTFDVNYRYNKTQASTSAQNSTFIWHDTSVATKALISPFQHISFYGAVEYDFLTGEQNDSGALPQIKPFKQSQEVSYRAGVNFVVDYTGTITIESISGYKKGARILFSRRF